ncbi:MAG: type II secretion system major pseudopilin GspG [bacterium]
MYNRKNKQKGFTLIELLVVLVILGLLAGVAAPKLLGQAEKAKIKAAKATIDRISIGLDTYYLDMGQLPDNLNQLVEKSGEDWGGPYIKKTALKDPWKEPYHYRAPGEHGEYDIYSYGPDKAQGGEGKNKDITSWE